MNKKTILLYSFAAVVGTVGGYLYFIFYGCQSGCSITSKPLNSSLYGAVMGVLVLSFFDKEKSSK